MFIRYPRTIILLFLILSLAGAYLAINRIQFSFDLQQFFPQGDEDLEFFLEFKERFEPDDNFLLIGICREEGVFEQKFLEEILEFSLEARRINFEVPTTDSIDNNIYIRQLNEAGDSVIIMNPVLSAQSLVQIEYPIRNIFTGFSNIPVLHMEDTSLYAKDSIKIMADERLVNNFISEDGKMLVVLLKTIDKLEQPVATELISQIKTLLRKHHFDDYHLLGKAFFMAELMRVQGAEFLRLICISFILSLLVFLFLFKRIWGVIIALLSISAGLMMFVGMLGLSGQTLDTMALLYPIIMIIVATSDVIHVMSKYIDELQLGRTKTDAIKITVREIGMSIFLTSTTTAIGFLSLTGSRLIPIQKFGMNAAIGVMIAYVTVIIFTTAVLTLFTGKQITKLQDKSVFWIKWMEWVYEITKTYSRQILAGIALLIIICFIGISKITSNTSFHDFLPKGAKVTEDFLFFEREMSGFRPFEVALGIQGDYNVHDFEVIKEIEKIERHYKNYPQLKSIVSVTGFYKSINQAYNGNKAEAFVIPDTEKQFNKYKKLAGKMEKSGHFGILVSKDKKHTRITGKVLDLGADTVNLILEKSGTWIAENIDPDIIQVRPTGTNFVMDKNSLYIRNSMLKGLFFALIVISIIISLIYRNLKLLIISIIPNIIPLLIAGAITGFWGIPFDAGVSIVFVVIFGIAIDDTIHLLSKFKLCKDRNLNTEESIRIMLVETGKAICFTSAILFFGFLSLYLSDSPTTYRIGMVMSSTLVSAVVCDLLLIPVMLRKWI
jgi:uncharacterized protein